MRFCHALGVAVSIVISGAVASARQSQYENTIAPEILRQYDRRIVSGSRPKIVTVTQDMIWSLRDNPDLGGDVYELELDLAKLPTAQREVLLRWVQGGRKVFLWGYYNKKVPPFFVPGIEHGNFHERPVLADHPVNTGVHQVRFGYYAGGGYCGLRGYPRATEVIAAYKSYVVAGRIPVGKGALYFGCFHSGNLQESPDSDRWTLNFYHWMLDLPVPGASASGQDVTPASSRIRAETKQTREQLVKENLALRAENANLRERIAQLGAELACSRRNPSPKDVASLVRRRSAGTHPDCIKARFTSGGATLSWPMLDEVGYTVYVATRRDWKDKRWFFLGPKERSYDLKGTLGETYYFAVNGRSGKSEYRIAEVEVTLPRE